MAKPITFLRKPKVPQNDRTKPSTPLNFAASPVEPSTARLTWSQSTDPITTDGRPTSGVAGYRIFELSAVIKTVTGATTLTTDILNVTPGLHHYNIASYDNAGNQSIISAQVNCTLVGSDLADTAAPSAPVLSRDLDTGTDIVALSWTASTDAVVGGHQTSGIAKYKLSRDGVVIFTDTMLDRAYADGPLNPGTYAYTVTAVDVAGNESTASNTATIVVPVPADTSTDLIIWPAQNASGLTIFPNIVGDGATSVGGSGRSASVRGSASNAGTGTTICRVNTINATAALTTNTDGTKSGSLRAALAANFPRTIVFETSGMSDWSSAGDLLVTNPNFTIHGHTAPAPGFYIRGAAIWVNGSNQCLEGLKFLCGDNATGPAVGNRGAIKAEGSSSNHITGLVIDRCSFYWGTDETVDIGQNINQLTFSHNIVAEGLWRNPLYPQIGSGFGHLLYGAGNGSGFGRTIRGNLYAQNYARNPLNYSPYARIDNNVIYNWGDTAMVLGDNFTEYSTYYAALRNNVVISGNHSKVHNKYLTIWSTSPSDARFPVPGGPGVDVKIYLSGNTLISAYQAAPAALGNQWDINWDLTNSEAAFKTLSNPLNDIGIVLADTEDTLENVLLTAGAFALNRDTKDQTIVDQVRDGTGDLAASVSAYGGWPTIAVNTINHVANGMPVSNRNSINLTHPKYAGATELEIYCWGFRDAKSVY